MVLPDMLLDKLKPPEPPGRKDQHIIRVHVQDTKSLRAMSDEP